MFESSNEKQRLVDESALVLELPNFKLCKGASSFNKASKNLILRNKCILDNARRYPTETFTFLSPWSLFGGLCTA